MQPQSPPPVAISLPFLNEEQNHDSFFEKHMTNYLKINFPKSYSRFSWFVDHLMEYGPYILGAALIMFLPIGLIAGICLLIAMPIFAALCGFFSNLKRSLEPFEGIKNGTLVLRQDIKRVSSKLRKCPDDLKREVKTIDFGFIFSGANQKNSTEFLKIIRSLQQFPGLQAISLRGHALGCSNESQEHAKTLFSELPKKLEILDLRDNQLHQFAKDVLSGCLTTLPKTLKKLYISDDEYSKMPLEIRGCFDSWAKAGENRAVLTFDKSSKLVLSLSPKNETPFTMLGLGSVSQNDKIRRAADTISTEEKKQKTIPLPMDIIVYIASFLPCTQSNSLPQVYSLINLWWTKVFPVEQNTKKAPSAEPINSTTLVNRNSHSSSFSFFNTALTTVKSLFSAPSSFR